MNVPFVDLQAEFREVDGEVSAAIRNVVQKGNFVLGPEVEGFEEAFARYVGSSCCIGVSSGTDALRMALEGIGISAGDEVIVPVNTFVATALAVTAIGAVPRFVDSVDESFLLDIAKAHEAVNSRTRAVIPVHLYGRMVAAEDLASFDLPVIEDAAQAHGQDCQGRRAGSVGRAGCFSFYPSKNLGAYGDGGAITTSDEELRDRLRLLRNYGQSRKYHHEIKGGNHRLDAIQAAVLRVKLKSLDRWNQCRRAAAAYYTNHLKDGISRPTGESVYHLYVIRVGNRDRLQGKLAEAGIDTGIHYPVPLHLAPCFKELGGRQGDFPVAERAAREILSLPMSPFITSEQQEYVVEKVNKWGEPV
ncbi:MAG: DegT/DnrJ/EryC1/StrS family aminotransferase [Proteobacteria bacterium]|nr:DegT/DnrJ/EryC1/StrS family aminotransferase [Pseudomonadota bacterium]MBU1686733.1 DegT/DnrJ/EryC1/StrS family aminotransferase [Pseudomonadota bacterium]